MRMLIILALGGLLLAGCNSGPGKTTITISRTVDDNGIDATRATFREGVAHLDCIHSKSGQCHFVLYTDDCTTGQACAPHVLDSITLAAGESKELSDVPKGVKLCVGHDAMPVPPACHAS
jgi:hypothetical protein